MAGTLYLVATPIGNLEDMTYRAIRILKEADIIAAEDTRTSGHLLRYFAITTPVTSYHKFNEEAKGDELTGELLSGKNVALITDAGTPAISDPGEVLVRKCIENGIAVTSLPGANACITALTISGQSTRRFAYEGFLPQDNREKKQVLEAIRNETRTMVFYEAPHRLLKTLTALQEVLGESRSITLCRELTKKFEESVKTTIGDAIARFEEERPRGEFVLVIAGKSKEELEQEEAASWESMTIAAHVGLYESKGFTRKDAMKAAAKDRGVAKRDIYAALLETKEDGSRS
jgi:16S rRNA (cytidine1402-2'-O)-methyltransferase